MELPCKFPYLWVMVGGWRFTMTVTFLNLILNGFWRHEEQLIGFCTRLIFLVCFSMRTGIAAYMEDGIDSLDTLDRSCEFCPSQVKQLLMWDRLRFGLIIHFTCLRETRTNQIGWCFLSVMRVMRHPFVSMSLSLSGISTGKVSRFTSCFIQFWDVRQQKGNQVLEVHEMKWAWFREEINQTYSLYSLDSWCTPWERFSFSWHRI